MDGLMNFTGVFTCNLLLFIHTFCTFYYLIAMHFFIPRNEKFVLNVKDKNIQKTFAWQTFVKNEILTDFIEHVNCKKFIL